MVTKVLWTRDALRELTIWLAGFIRDEIELRAIRGEFLDDIEDVLVETDGRPPHSYAVLAGGREVTVWEYVGRRLYLVFRRETRPAGFVRRLFGRPDREILIVATMRRPPTLPELESLPE